ncbi:MAG: hypothetical protein P1U42_05300 [Phycisphaerales bacterium]|nr:hypothetical protein [Phycisphaerales bacterium]
MSLLPDGNTSDLDGNVFDWPPASIETNLPLETSDSSQILKQSAFAALFESIEQHLLGRNGIAFDKWATKTGWQRDPIEAYCWRCGGSVGQHESDGEGCATCRSKPLPWDRAIRLGLYQGILRNEVLTLKFKAWRPTGRGLGLHLGYAIKEQLERAQIQPHQVAIVPIPMHRIRRISRGVDHTQVLASAASQVVGCPILRILDAKHRQEQVGLSKTARAKNIRGAFTISERKANSIRRRYLKKIRVFILLDDVRTTGATFVAAGKALKSSFGTNSVEFTEEFGLNSIWICSVGVAGEGRRSELEAQR